MDEDEAKKQVKETVDKVRNDPQLQMLFTEVSFAFIEQINKARQDERLKIKREMGNITIFSKKPRKKLKLRYAPWFKEFWEKYFMRNK